MFIMMLLERTYYIMFFPNSTHAHTHSDLHTNKVDSVTATRYILDLNYTF